MGGPIIGGGVQGHESHRKCIKMPMQTNTGAYEKTISVNSKNQHRKVEEKLTEFFQPTSLW